MKETDYQMAIRLKERIAELQAMQKILYEKLKELKEEKDLETAQDLANLMFELIKDNNGVKVVDTFVANISWDLQKGIRECQEQFENL